MKVGKEDNGIEKGIGGVKDGGGIERIGEEEKEEMERENI